MAYLGNVLRGFLMGSADIVPGVSGGTVALVLGIYERLIHNIRTGAAALGAVLRGQIPKAVTRVREVEWGFIGALLVGVGVAIVSLARLLDALLEDHPQAMAGLFIGLIVGSIAIAWSRVREWAPQLVVAAAGAAVATFAILGVRSGEIAEPATVAYLGAGALAIVAMILPGVSGSFILLMIGMYEAILAAVNDRDVAILAVFAAGAIVGLAAFSTVLDRLLRDHHDLVMAVLIGVMVGSLRVLWPWPDGAASARLGAPTDWAAPLLLAIAGAVAVLAIARPSTPTDND